MFRKSAFRSRFLAIALGATALASIAAEPARAADIGARVYVQPWIPEAAAQDQVQTAYDDHSIVSDSVKKAWSESEHVLKVGIFMALNGRRVGPGLTLAGGAAQLNDVTDFALSGSRGAATLEFRVPKTVVTVSVGAKALSDADDYTAGLATDLLTPMLDITFDMLLSLSLNVSGNSVIATDMHAIVLNPTVTPRNDAAKALKGINDIVAFVGGPDFVKVLEDQFNNDDLKDKSLLTSINEGIAPVGQAEQKAAASTGYNLITFWGDSNRLTFYYAPLPRTDIPADAAMIGNVRWDPTQFPTANCSSFKVFTDVQTGPRPLLLSDGHSYGVAPTQRVGHFSARPAAVRATLGGGGSCDYTISGLPRKWFHNTSATTTAVPPNASGGSNPQLGNQHSAGYMLPVGWDGLSVIPDPLAANKDYELLRGMAGSPALGNPHAVLPGQKQEGTPVYSVDPAVRILQQQGQSQTGPAVPVIVNRLPRPPVQNDPRQTEGHGTSNNGTANNAQSQAQQPAPQQPAEQHPTTPGGKSSINPQPLPPRIQQQAAGGSNVYRPGSRVMINPQPLPPKPQNSTNGIK